MASTQHALHPVESHVHLFSETCPTCEQPIPNEKAKEIRARAAAMEKRLADEAEARAAQKFAMDKAQIEEAAKAEGQKLAEADFTARLEAAEKAKVDAEAAATAAAQAAKAQQEETRTQLEAANIEKALALAERDAIVEERVREVREAMEKDTADKLAARDSANDTKMQKVLAELDTVKRQLEQRRADELGEGAHIKLLDALKEEFPGDDIRRIRPGVSGADILHTVLRNGISSGSILWESKNSIGWRDEYVTKLIRDQTAAKADHAVLSTFKFPRETSQVAIRDDVVIVNPARAVTIAHMLRKHLLHVHKLRLSKSERQEKMAALYDFMTSERYTLLTGRLDTGRMRYWTFRRQTRNTTISIGRRKRC
jgi:hypothetical protein